MQPSNGNCYWVKKCANCNELMPVSEKICYCDGPVKILKVNEEEWKKTKEYGVRKWYEGWKRKYGI